MDVSSISLAAESSEITLYQILQRRSHDEEMLLTYCIGVSPPEEAACSDKFETVATYSIEVVLAQFARVVYRRRRKILQSINLHDFFSWPEPSLKCDHVTGTIQANQPADRRVLGRLREVKNKLFCLQIDNSLLLVILNSAIKNWWRIQHSIVANFHLSQGT